MKPFKDVESARVQYHSKPSSNSVHRSSLIVPVISGNDVELSLLNHFLIKRGYKEVTCRITAVTDQGHLIDALDFLIDKPCVYTFSLKSIFASYKKAPAAYNIEFYSSKNLFIPYTAAIVNHVGTKIVNQVHAYNRTLNDVFENDTVNAISVKEACIDVIKNEEVETFLLFNAGVSAVDSELTFELTATGSESRSVVVPVKVSRFNSLMIKLSEVFPDLTVIDGGYLRVLQPKQDMFYGRLLCGLIDNENNVVANHSYYDSSLVEEYWDDSIPSFRNYPVHQDLELLFRIYPIMSPGNYEFEVSALKNGEKILIGTECLQSPSGAMLELNINQMLQAAGLLASEVSTVQLSAKNKAGKTPTRITHQLVYREINGFKKLGSSVNISLLNRNVYSPKGRTGRVWGQVIIGKDLNGFVGISSNFAYDKAVVCQVTLYCDKGLLLEKEVILNNEESAWLAINDLLAENKLLNHASERSYIWYWITSDHPSIAAYSVTKHSQSGYVTAEHSF